MPRSRVLIWNRFSTKNDTINDNRNLFAITRNKTGTVFSLRVSTELGGPGLDGHAVETYTTLLLAKDSAVRGLYPKDNFTAPVPRVKRPYNRRVIEAPAPAPAKRTKTATKATKATKAAPVPAKRAKKVTEAPPVPAKRSKKVAEAVAPTPPKRTRAKASKPPVAVANDTAPAPETESAAA